MNTPREGRRRQEQFSAFWERMARHYPHPFDEEMLAETRRVIALVKSKGVEISEASVLDIGCGTGIYTLPLAREAAMVIGLDDSEAMMARLADEIAAARIHNVHSTRSSWKDADLSSLGFEKAFDIAWASMTPAVQTQQDFERMEQCARKWCVYIGWGRKRRNTLMEEAFSAHGLRYGPPPGVGAAYEVLVGLGRAPSLDYFETSWDWEGTAAEALEDMVCFIEMQGAGADRDLLAEVLSRHERGGRVYHKTDVEEGVLVWRVGYAERQTR